jgi:hypothetical protein
MTAVFVRKVDAQLGPTSGAWPTTDEEWQDWPAAQVIEDAEGHANDVGSASLRVLHGLVALPGSTTDAADSPPTVYGAGTSGDPYQLAYSGQYVRLRYYDANGENPTAYWWGTIGTMRYQPRGSAEFELLIDCIGLLGVLERAIVLQGPEQGIDATGASGLVWTQAGTNPNGAEGGAGDRSAGTFTVGGNAIRAVDRLLAGAARQTAQDVLLALLVQAENQQGQLFFDVAGQLDALNYSDDWDLYDMTVREAIARVVNPRYGVTYSLTMVNHVPTLHIDSILATAINSAGVVLPASARQTSIDAATTLTTKCEEYTEDNAAVADIIIMEAPPTLHVLTVSYEDGASDPLLLKGWESADETAWDAADDNEREAGKLASVWRRFVFAPAWRGGDVDDPTTVWDTARVVSGTSDALHGYQGATGAFGADSTDPLVLPHGRRHRLPRMLPLYEGVDWTDTGVTTWDRNAPRLRPMVFVEKDGDWQTIGDYLGREMTMGCDDIDGSIVLGNGAADAQAIADIIADGYSLNITLAVYHPYSTRVSWVRDPALWPRVEPRIMARTFPQVERWLLRGTAVMGVDDAGAPQTRGADLVVLDSLPILRDQLALSRTYYAEPARTARFHFVGFDTSTTYRPGALVTTARLPFGDTAASFVLQNVITRRGHKWVEDAGYGTYYSTKRLLPDLDMMK